MPLRLIEVYAAPSQMDTIAAIAERLEALSFWREPSLEKEMAACRIVARPGTQQELMDQLQSVLGAGKTWRIVILPVDATVPDIEWPEGEQRSSEQATREELYAAIEGGARLDTTFLLLVVLSTIVAAIGLIQNSVAIVIAAMLIAPLLGPNIAMAFGSTLGDRELVLRGAATNAAGIILSVICAAAVALAFPTDSVTSEFLTRTQLSYDGIILALASGAAGALSLTTRLPSTLVGVMVAVALLPPAATLGYMLGTGRLFLAAGAFALLLVNIVCVNLSAQIVFLVNGLKPRKWIERRSAKQSVKISLAVACGLLVALIGVVYWQHG